MPTAPPRICGNCKARFTGKHCNSCEAQRQKEVNNRRDPKWKRLYDSPAWKRLRLKKLANDPFCEYELETGLRCNKLAKHVDHISAVSAGGARLPALSELMSMCISCHSRKTVREDGGFKRK